MGTSRHLPGLLALAFGLITVAQPAEAQGLFDRVKEAAKNTVNEARDAATNTLREEGMNQAGFLLLAEGAFAGTAAPWIVEGEPDAFAEIAGNAYVAPDRLALVLCQGEGALDGIVFQGNFGAVEGKTDLFLADQDFTVFLISGGRSYPMRGDPGQIGSLTTGTLRVEPGEAGGLKGTVSLAIGEGAVSGSRLMPDLFARSRVVEIDGSFRAVPVESIEEITCDAATEQHGSSYLAPPSEAPPVASSPTSATSYDEARQRHRRSEGQGQGGASGSPEVYTVVEEMPQLIGGLEELQRRVQYPASARRAGIEGRVFVQFIVEVDGRVSDAAVVRGLGGGPDEEALRVIRTASFTPGMQRGRPARVRMSLPITFQLR